MTFAIGAALVLTKARPALPCADCLSGLGEASGMAGAATCPLKGALLRRLAAARPAGLSDAVTCDGFAPGFNEMEAESAGFDAAGVRLRLS